MNLEDAVERLAQSVKRYGSTVRNTMYAAMLGMSALYATPQEVVAEPTTSYAPAYVTASPQYSPTADYEQPTPMFYVHTPPWVTMKAAYREEMGGAFGLAFINTGLIMYDKSQSPSVQQEIKLHELIHQLYPSMTEPDVRGMVVAILGTNAELHNEIGLRGAQ